MRLSIAFVLSLTFTTSLMAETKKGDPSNLPYEICICNFNGCLGQKTTKCATATKCTKVTEQQFTNALNNKSSIMMMIDSRAFCVDPKQFYLKN